MLCNLLCSGSCGVKSRRQRSGSQGSWNRRTHRWHPTTYLDLGKWEKLKSSTSSQIFTYHHLIRYYPIKNFRFGVEHGPRYHVLIRTLPPHWFEFVCVSKSAVLIDDVGLEEIQSETSDRVPRLQSECSGWSGWSCGLAEKDVQHSIPQSRARWDCTCAIICHKAPIFCPTWFCCICHFNLLCSVCSLSF